MLPSRVLMSLSITKQNNLEPLFIFQMPETPSFRSAAALVTVIRQLMHQQPSPNNKLHLDNKLLLHHHQNNKHRHPDHPCNSIEHLQDLDKHRDHYSCNDDTHHPNLEDVLRNKRDLESDNGNRQQEQQPDSHCCGECGKRYSTSSNLARHRQTHRSTSDARAARRCPSCGKVYVSAPAFAMHVRTHAQGCRCPYCGKCFSRPWLLQGHVRTHTGEKPFRCPVCAKAFADKSNLRAHVQTHSSSKPFVCGRCGKAFALKSYLYKHEESSCMRVGQHRGKTTSETTNDPLDLATTAVRVG